MTREALRAESGENPRSRSRVARLALHRCMRSEKREAIAVVLSGAHRLKPAAHCVAVLATSAELLLMDVGVAVRTFDSDVAENRAAMAVGASNGLVQAAQGVLGFRIVIELRNGANRLPTRRRVTVLAGDIESAVRVPRTALLRLLGAKHRPQQQQR